MAYDTLIKSGTILDGESDETKSADLGISGDKISAVGKLGNASAETIIDATGKYVVPGFIDITNHSDTHLTLFKYPQLDSLLMQGVTTIIGGNCGSSLAPLGSPQAINSIRKWVDPGQINVNWATVGEYLDQIESLRLGVNFGTFIGYGTLRRGVVGDEARPLGLEEREKLKYLLREGIKEGAFGLSLGLSYGHERASTTEEIVEIGKTLLETWGTIKIHLRSEGKEIIAAVNEAVRIHRGTNIPVQISHLKAIGKKSWPLLPKVLEILKNAKNSEANINFDVSPYNTTGSLLYLLVPAWARAGGFTDLFKRLADQWEREKIVTELQSYTLHYDKILVVSAKTSNAVGKTLAEIAENSGLSPEEAMLDIIKANEGRVTIVGRTVSSRNTELEIKDENSFVVSDGAGYGQDEVKSGSLVHPRSFGAFPHFWHRFVNDRKILSPQEAIKKVTSGPAKKIGLKNRGVIKKGNFADVVIFDPLLIRDRANYQNPFRYPAGIDYVIVNGKIAVDKGRVLNARSGKVLRKT